MKVDMFDLSQEKTVNNFRDSALKTIAFITAITFLTMQRLCQYTFVRMASINYTMLDTVAYRSAMLEVHITYQFLKGRTGRYIVCLSDF